MKQLPKEFVFVCDKHSREQLERLNIELGNFNIASQIYGAYFRVVGNKVFEGGYHGYKATSLPLIDLSNYIEQEQNIITTTDDGSFRVPNNPSTRLEFKTDGRRIPIEQKWQEKTRGGYEYVIYEEFEGVIYGRVKNRVGWDCIMWFKYGGAKNYVPEMDLLPLDPHAQRKAEVKSEIERLQKELESLK